MSDNNNLSLRLKTVEFEQEQLLDELLDIKTSLGLIGEKSKQKKISSELLEIETQIIQLQTKFEEDRNINSSIANDSLEKSKIDSENSEIDSEKSKIDSENSEIDSKNYVICLMFSHNTPPEWSGNRWRISGKGKCYSTSKEAYQCLQQLQQKWPDYPIEILKR